MIRFDHELLRDIRKRNGLKQADVAEKLHCSGATISRFELGDTKITAEDLASLLSIYHEDSADQFFVRTIEGNNIGGTQ